MYLGNNPFIIFGAFRNYPWIKGISRIILLMFMFIIYYVTIDIIKEKDIFKNSVLFFIITSVLISIYGLVGYTLNYINSSLYFPMFFETLTFMRIKSVFNEPLFLGNYLLSILPVIYCLLAAKVKYINRYFLWGSLIILTLTLFLTESRGAWVGYIIFIVLFFILYWRSLLKAALNPSLYILLLLCLLFVIDFTFFDSELGKQADIKISNIVTSVSSPLINAITPSTEKFWSTRVRLWSIESAFNTFKQHPILGVGYSNYGFYSGMKVYDGLYLSAINISEVNNYPFSVLVEMGFVGLIALIWLTWKIIKSIVKKLFHETDEIKKALITGYALSLLAVSAQLMFFSYIMSAYIWVMLAMAMSLCYVKIVTMEKLE
jgi:O-antigen ligase